MKLSVTKIGLIAGMSASIFLLGACASTQAPGHASVSSGAGYAHKTGELVTAWGKLPTYSHQSTDLRQFKAQFSRLPAFFAGIENTATVDVLVNRDGTVRDVAIIKGSGYLDKDASVKDRLEGVHLTTKIAPEDAAPYVFRTVVTFQKTRGEYDGSASNYYVTNPQTHYAEQPVSPAAGVW